jgi:hypothetical protein
MRARLLLLLNVLLLATWQGALVLVYLVCSAGVSSINDRLYLMTGADVGQLLSALVRLDVIYRVVGTVLACALVAASWLCVKRHYVVCWLLTVSATVLGAFLAAAFTFRAYGGLFWHHEWWFYRHAAEASAASARLERRQDATAGSNQAKWRRALNSDLTDPHSTSL